MKNLVSAAGDLAEKFRADVDELREKCIKRDRALDDQKQMLKEGPLKEAKRLLKRLDDACLSKTRAQHLQNEQVCDHAREPSVFC